MIRPILFFCLSGVKGASGDVHDQKFRQFRSANLSIFNFNIVDTLQPLQRNRGMRQKKHRLIGEQLAKIKLNARKQKNELKVKQRM